MILNFTKRKKSVIYSWIVSYILIILIPVAVTGIVYYIAKNTIEEEINSSNELLLEKLKDNMDNTLSDIERFSAEVASSQNIQDVLSIDKLDNDAHYYTIYKAANSLSNYRIFNSTLKRFYIYFNNLNTVISRGTIYSQEVYYNGYLASEGYSMEKWLEAMNKSYRGEYHVMPYHDDHAGDEKGVGFIRSLPIFLPGTSFSANLVVLLDFNTFIENESGDFSKRNLFIIDKAGKIMAGNKNDEEFSDISYGELENASGSINKTFKGREVVVSYTTSAVNGWKYIIVTPEAVFWEKAQFIRNIMVGSLFVCIFLGGILSYFFIRKNYNPLKEVVSYFKDNSLSKDDLKNNEYGFMKQALSETLEQKETIRLKLEQQNKALKSSFIESLLKGRNKDVPVHELLTSYNISFKYKCFTVMAVFIDSMDEEFWNKDYGNIDNYGLSRFIIVNVVEELINKRFIGYMTEVDDMLVCLVNMDSDGESYKSELLPLIDEAKSFMESNYKISMTFAIGSLHESFEGVPEAFAEALNAVEYSRVMGIGNVVFHDEIPRETGNSYYYPVDKEYQLINCIKSADFPAAASIVDDIFQKNFVNNSPSLEIARCLMFDLISTVLKTAGEIEKPEDRGFVEKMNPVSELLKCRTFLEMKNKLLKILEEACEYVSQNKGQTDYRVRDMAVEIIEKNFSDPNLGIASIAEQVGRHPYYISRVFKEQTGEGILEYINRIRINQAKELLKENVWNQEEIAQKVGYTNVRTFQRAFKKHEGTSPGKLKI